MNDGEGRGPRIADVAIRDGLVVAIGASTSPNNVIGFQALKVHAPMIARKLPAGGHRLRQLADGYVATIVSCGITYRRPAYCQAASSAVGRPPPPPQRLPDTWRYYPN